jgi:predicted phage terminase large subunit-like protein
MDYPSLKRAVREQWQAHGATVVLIEDKASGTQLIQELIEEGLQAVTRYKPDGDKQMRLHAQTGAIENGFVYLPGEAHWLAEYLHELTTFPNSKYDDQVDSTSQALAWTKRRSSALAWIEFMRRQVEAQRPGASPTVIVRLKPAVATSSVYTMSGLQIPARPDGTFDLGVEDAKPLLMAGWQRLPPAPFRS